MGHEIALRDYSEMKLFAVFAAAASAIDLTTLALLQNGSRGNGFGTNPFALMALTGNDKLDADSYMMMNALSGKGIDLNDPIIMAQLLDGGLDSNLSKLMLFSGNMNFQQNPLLAMSMMKGDNSELSKLAMLNSNNPNGLNNMLGLDGYSGFGKK